MTITIIILYDIFTYDLSWLDLLLLLVLACYVRRTSFQNIVHHILSYQVISHMISYWFISFDGISFYSATTCCIIYQRMIGYCLIHRDHVWLDYYWLDLTWPDLTWLVYVAILILLLWCYEYQINNGSIVSITMIW